MADDLLSRMERKLSAALLEAFNLGRHEQRKADVELCKRLSATRDSGGEGANAYDCQRAIALGLSPEEAARRVREGERLDG